MFVKTIFMLLVGLYATLILLVLALLFVALNMRRQRRLIDPVHEGKDTRPKPEKAELGW